MKLRIGFQEFDFGIDCLIQRFRQDTDIVTITENGFVDNDENKTLVSTNVVKIEVSDLGKLPDDLKVLLDRINQKLAESPALFATLLEDKNRKKRLTFCP